MITGRYIYTLIGAICFTIQVAGQDTLFFENFDDSPGTKPSGWTTELETAESKWEFVNGGGTKTPLIPGSRRPPTAYSEPVNALYFFESLEGEEVILVTPPVDLELAIRPELRFRHVQREGNLGFGSAHDELRVYYKTHFDSTWTEARKIAQYTDEVFDWTEQIIILPEEAFVPECYFAFKAKTNYGWGVGIDDVAIVETEVLAREVHAVTVSQAETGNIPSGSKNNPILSMDVAVKGNTGTLTLNSLNVTSLNTSDTDVGTYGVKLHSNQTSKDFYASTVLDSATFVSGQAVFSSLNLDLQSGHNYLWVSYDIEPDAVHNHQADAMLQAGSISIGAGSYPGSTESPAGSRTIQEAVFFDDFSTDKGWSLAGDFERDRPQGLGGQFLGNPDPLYASGDTMILGNDLTGLGSSLGDYEANVSRYGNLATSPEFNLYYYNEVKLNFLRWLNVANNDTASIEMSVDGGSEWTEIWSNDNNVYADGQWKLTTLDIPGARGNSQVSLRFNLGPTTSTDNLSGWNIENFAITGNYMDYDVSPVALLAPMTGCGLSASEIVSIRVENLGPGATPDGIPVRYSFDGGTNFTLDTIWGAIPLAGQRDFDFTETTDLTAPGEYHVIIETNLNVDEEPTNDRLDTILYVDPFLTLPYSQDFESNNGNWRVEGVNPTFEYGTPGGSIIHTAASGVNAWVTNLDGDYNNNEDSYLVGPCFDFTGIDYPVFECQLNINTITDYDGANLEYSLNNGQTWSRVGNLGDGDEYFWNWYNSDIIAALAGGHGWTGGPGTWHLARILLDTTIFRNNASVKFRFHFSSDDFSVVEGIGIDDIRIYDAPKDVGVISIEAPVDGCAQDIGDHVAITVQNFGLDTLMAGDTILVGYDLESDPTVTEFFILPANLLSGATLPYVFSEPVEISSAGTKNIEAFTLIEEDPDFYNAPVYNDTASKTFEVALTPFVFLPDTIYTVQPDTIVLDAYTGNPSDTYLWQDASTDPQFYVSLFDDGVYYVTASNGFCEYSDTTRVYRLIVDLGVSGILDPVSDCELGDAVTPRVEITNFGTDTLHAGDQVTLRYQVDQEALITEIAVISTEVFPDSTFEYTFSTASDMSATKVYTLSSYTEIPFDDDPVNDTIKQDIEVFGYTPVELGPDTVIRAFEYVLDAGPGNDMYLWQDASTGQTLTVDTTGQYHVTVQAGTMCANSDTINIIMVIPDISIQELYGPSNSCGLTDTEHVMVYIHNSGTDTLLTNDTIHVTYQFEADPEVDEDLILGGPVLPGDSLLFTSSGTVDMSAVGTYHFLVYVSFSGDLIPDNDTLDQMIEVYAPPVVSLGADTVVHSKTFLLDAGAGFVSYLWQDGSGDQQYVAEFENQTPDSIYSVTVTDVNGCEASDDIKIAFDFWDIGVSSVGSPVTTCTLTDHEELRVFVKNFGTHAIVDEDLTVKASVDGGLPITRAQNIAVPLNPGDSVEFLFVSTFNFSSQGDHTIQAYTLYGIDEDLTNDTIEVIVTHLGSPQPDLGGTNDSLETSLPLTLDGGTGYVSYLWNGNPGGQTYEATGYGWYTLEVTAPNGCTGQDSLYLFSTVGITDFYLPGHLNVYPVPADQLLHVEYTYSEAANLFLDIFDANGRKILEKEYPNLTELIETLDVSGLTNGIYYLRLHSDEQQLTRQIIIY